MHNLFEDTHFILLINKPGIETLVPTTSEWCITYVLVDEIIKKIQSETFKMEAGQIIIYFMYNFV